jgi:hypothetical protein
MYKRFAAGILFILYQLFFVGMAHAQEKNENVFLHPNKFYKKYFPHLKIKYNPSDSNYIKTYPNSYMTVALHLLSPKIYANIIPSGAPQAASQLRTNINTITGLSFSYRHITAGFALSLLPPVQDQPGYTHSRYHTATIKYKSPIYILTFKYMKIKGMTDVNPFNASNTDTPYTQRPDITLKEYQFEGIYNFSWKKYSYLATLDFTQDQIKSRVGLLLKAGVYNQQLYSDSALLSMQQRSYFEQAANITKIVSYSVKFAPGIGANIVIKKHFYIAASVFSPLNLYVNRLYSDDNTVTRKQTSIQWVADGSASIGYQSKYLYAALRCELDARTTSLNTISYTTVYNYIGLDIGYRFTAPKVVKKFYKQTMPPGM